MSSARTGTITTIGIRPTAPETGYGYLHVGDAMPDAPLKQSSRPTDAARAHTPPPSRSRCATDG